MATFVIGFIVGGVVGVILMALLVGRRDGDNAGHDCDIPQERYEEYKRIGDSRDILFEAIRKGTVLPEHHGDLVDRNSFEYLKTLNDAIHGKMSWSDALHKIRYSAPTIIPATKEERKCTDCKWYGLTCECPVHCTQDTKIAWEPATKEGEEK